MAKKAAKNARSEAARKPVKKTTRAKVPARRSPARKPRDRSAAAPHENGHVVIRPGGPPTIFTIGYQGRDGDEIVELLLEAGIEHLADIRAKPLSRNPDFRAGPLRRRCEAAGIEYGSWQSLGTPDPIRARVKATRDCATFHRDVRENAIESMGAALDEMAALARSKRVALLCLERAHDECHRADIAELVADRIGAGIVAIA